MPPGTQEPQHRLMPGPDQGKQTIPCRWVGEIGGDAHTAGVLDAIHERKPMREGVITVF